MEPGQPNRNSPLLDSSTEQRAQPLSKNQLKKIRRQKDWESKREKRKEIRKQKSKDRKQRNREARENAIPAASPEDNGRKHLRPTQLPITIIVDCGFEDYMSDSERTSLASQITRCYSENQRSPLQTHLAISSFGGHLKKRFDTVLAGHHQNWKDVKFHEEDFEQVAGHAAALMHSSQGGKLAGVFESNRLPKQTSTAEDFQTGELVYLTSDSPDTLTQLQPYSTYVLGGLVDRNRHKGLCYKRAKDRGIKTAKLPIGDYMQMASRFVLTTNHVMEIMLRYLELGDWGQALLRVVPKRKGAVLKAIAAKVSKGALEDDAGKERIEDDADKEASKQQARSNSSPPEEVLESRHEAREPRLGE
ncbi:MAG: hypothetical protein Q9214_007540 [Letrouitia sp. 1 TL-2023]